MKVNSRECSTAQCKPREVGEGKLVHKDSDAHIGVHWVSLKHLPWVKLSTWPVGKLPFILSTNLQNRFYYLHFEDEEN